VNRSSLLRPEAVGPRWRARVPLLGEPRAHAGITNRQDHDVAAAFADELEREKARQRTADAMDRKARAGHVTGGKVFGYENVRLNSHVERRILESEAVVVRSIYEMYAKGAGYRHMHID
jgi:DNA invertase Pin-like site-specific DNA recombinase